MAECLPVCEDFGLGCEGGALEPVERGVGDSGDRD